MFHRSCKIALALGAAMAAIGCQSERPPIVLDTRGVEPAVGYGHLADVLASAVDSDGLIDPDALAELTSSLDAQLKLLAVTGPTATPDRFPTAEARLAYWYNARAAWSLKLLLVEKCPAEISRAALDERRFPLDGREMSLREIDANLAADDDFRVAVAAPGVTTNRAALPVKPFQAASIRKEIPARFAAFMNDEGRLVINVRRQRIVVPPVLWQFRDRLLEAHRKTYGVGGANLTTALLPYVEGSPERRLQDAIGYRIVEDRSRKLPTCVRGSY